MSGQNLKNSLIGAFEIFIMMPTVMERFSPQKEDAPKSFIFPLLQYPLILWAFSQTNHTHDPVVLLLHVITSWGGLLAFYGIVCAVCRTMQKRDYFWQFITMANTYYILGTVLLLPIFLTIYAGKSDGLFFQQYWAFFILADLAFTAFIVAKSLRVNWMIGAFLATLNLFLSDIGSRLILFYTHEVGQVALNTGLLTAIS